ncbi:juvenile hormone epoxide hydrolase-like [Bicyclus anynana]|uniref:Epoxide hydrolase n=1 Tax=Bicyclus anynana TaxID=110368 RepID=A0A6J1NNP4_BICAN|nr:juvenile hormone epoxide hydrolase-like [Bicyclus anynana]
MVIKVMWSLVLVVAVAWVTCAELPERPQLDLDEWWGPEDAKRKANTTIWPFQIKFTTEMIKDLKSRLQNNRAVTPPLSGTGFNYGFNQLQIEPWVKYWTDKYDFKQREKFLNKFPQYQTNIQGLNIHFIWVKPHVPAGVTCVPLLIMHGWGGSVREFYEAIPLLTTPTDGLVFEVIAPSLPGFGFSQGTTRPGLGAAQMAVILRNLMYRLGHEKYIVQGGDWGALTGSAMATMFPETVFGFHSNMLGDLSNPSEIQIILGGVFASIQSLQAPLDPVSTALVEETAYLHEYSTKPDTIGAMLSNCPIGLLALFLEKFSTWTNLENRNLEDGGLSKKFTKEQLLDNIMIYWVSNSITTSLRIYAETFSISYRKLGIDTYPCMTPTWKCEAKNEKIFYQPPNMKKFPYLIEVSKLGDGGHFLAFELPDLFVQDVFKAVKAFIKFHEDEAGRCEL